MILSNVELHCAIDEKRLIIVPEPEPRNPSLGNGDCPFDTHSVDLRLSDEISVPTGGMFAYDVSKPGDIAGLLQQHSTSLQITDAQPYHLKPQQFILGKTYERVELPIEDGCETCLSARIEGKSSRARIGLLVHFTAPTVHPGFEGHLTLEMINLGAADILLSPMMFIAQLIVEEVRGCPIQNPSEFQGQTTAVGLSGSAADATRAARAT